MEQLRARASALSVLHVNLAREWFKRLRRKHRGVVIAALAIAAVALAIAVIWPITDLLAAHDVGLVSRPMRAAALLTAREAVRTQLLTLGAGVFAAGALIFTGLNFILSRRTVNLTRQTFELAGQGQVTDRYTRAIEQLGSDSPSVRLGAIFAMERIARDSARDSPSVMGVLAAYVREQSRDPKSWRDPVFAPSTDVQASDVRLPGPDLSAALAVLGRRVRGLDADRPDLVNADLSSGYLQSAILDRISLMAALLMGADLTDADLSGALLLGANLTRADLTRANLRGAGIMMADFTNANLTDADLSGADWGAFLGPTLTGAILAGTIVDSNVSLPPEWKRDPESGRVYYSPRDQQGSAAPS